MFHTPKTNRQKEFFNFFSVLKSIKVYLTGTSCSISFVGKVANKNKIRQRQTKEPKFFFKKESRLYSIRSRLKITAVKSFVLGGIIDGCVI